MNFSLLLVYIIFNVAPYYIRNMYRTILLRPIIATPESIDLRAHVLLGQLRFRPFKVDLNKSISGFDILELPKTLEKNLPSVLKLCTLWYFLLKDHTEYHSESCVSGRTFWLVLAHCTTTNCNDSKNHTKFRKPKTCKREKKTKKIKFFLIVIVVGIVTIVFFVWQWWAMRSTGEQRTNGCDRLK